MYEFINKYLFTFKFNIKKRTIGNNEDVNVAIIAFNDNGPVIVLLPQKKKLSPFQFSKVFIFY